MEANIFDKIKEMYGDDDDLRRFILSIADGSANFAMFNSAETGKSTDQGTWKESAVFLLPDYPDDPEYKKKFQTMLSNNWKKGAPQVARNSHPNEIIILTSTTCFPLRFFNTINYIKKEYDAKCADVNNGIKNKIFMHTEDETSANRQYVQYPSLFLSTASQQRADSAPYALIAMALGFVVVEKTEDGRHKYYKTLGEGRAKTSLGIEKFRNFSKDDNEKIVDVEKEIVEIVEKKLRSSSNEELDSLRDNLQKGYVHQLLLHECDGDKTKAFLEVDEIRQKSIAILKEKRED